MKLSDFKETLDRYKKCYPVICEGRDDIDILLYRNVINEAQAIKLAQPEKLPESNAGGAGKEIEPKEKKVRPYTYTQVEKMCREMVEDFVNDCPDVSIEDAAYDMAEGLLSTDLRMIAYFEQTNIKKEYWIESLADNFVI